jgi:hypothetical protein
MPDGMQWYCCADHDEGQFAIPLDVWWDAYEKQIAARDAVNLLLRMEDP